MGTGLRVVFMGSPAFAVPPLARLADEGFDIAAVYTRPDKPAGRGRALAAAPVKTAAQSLGLEVRQPAGLRPPEVAAALAALRPDAVVVAAYGQILPPAVLAVPRLGCVNIHPSLLPRFRGASPVASAILAGDEFTGVTIMLMDEGLDTGPVLIRAQIPIAAPDTTGALTDKLSRVGAGLLLEALSGLARGQLAPRLQDNAQATYCRPIAKEQGEIDWRLPAVEIWRRVRAYQPWPGAYTRWRGRKLDVIAAAPLTLVPNHLPGTIVPSPAPEHGFSVVTGEGALGISQVKLEGRRAVAATEFVRGQRDFIGAALG